MTTGPSADRLPDDALRGLVERVTFHNDETGFAVLRVKVGGKRDLMTVVGPAATANPGEWITAEGRWTRDREHGMQFRADRIETQPPDSAEGIEKYLASGMIRGIGPTYAKKLVDKFGASVFDIIDKESARLQEVDGIGPERRRSIKAAWAEQRVIREIMVFLHANGVSTSRAVRIYKSYGEDAISRIRNDPYCLAKDIHGIGFKSADSIAMRLGIDADSLLRIRAGLAHAVAEASGDGHCALPRADLIQVASTLLDVDLARVEDALGREIARGELVEESIGGESLVFLPALRTAEEQIASKILALAARKATGYPAIQVEKALEWVQEKTGIALSESQADALRTALAHPVAVITGGPGVGKTTLVNAILKILRAKGVRCVLCAPTGRAAQRLGEATGLEAKTIHRLLEPRPGGGFLRDEGNPLEGKLFVMDEVSMVDVPLMARFLRALPAGGNLICVGDPDQLPSVGPGLVLRALIETRVVPCIQLDVVFRQAEASRIIRAAHAINAGKLPEREAPENSDFFFIERADSQAIADTIIDLVKTRIPGKFGLDPVRDIQVLAAMRRGTVGVRSLNERLQDALNPRREPDFSVQRFGAEFRAGDKVLQTRNNYDKDVFNGDIGIIRSIDPGEREVTVDFDAKRRVTYDFGELDELEAAFAITVHKSQGSEFPCVIIPVAMEQYLLLQRNLIYTAVTRGKRLVLVVGPTKALATAVRNHEVVRRNSGLSARLAPGR